MPPKNAIRPLKSRSQSVGLHVRGFCLQRVQTIDPGFDQALDDAMDGAAGMKDHLVSAPFGLRGEFSEPGHDECVELLRSADQIALRAKVVAEKESVYQFPRCVEKALIRLVVKGAHPVGDSVHQFGVFVHVDQIVFHTKQVHNVVVKGRPEPAGAVKRPNLPQRLQYRAEIEVVGIGPIVGVNLADILALGKRTGVPVGGLARDLEQALSRGMAVDPGGNPAKIIAQTSPQLFVCRSAEKRVV